MVKIVVSEGSLQFYPGPQRIFYLSYRNICQKKI